MTSEFTYAEILVAEDDPDVRSTLRKWLERYGLQPSFAETGKKALALHQERNWDLIILDVMLPELDGLEVCREIRKEKNTPILILSARDDDVDKIMGLELGADDYLTKPFNPHELIARVRALLRRTAMMVHQTSNEPNTIKHGEFRIDQARHKVFHRKTELDLTPIEYKLLLTLLRRPGQVFSRDHLLSEAWGPDYFGTERTVDSHIRNLRKKLHTVDAGDKLEAVRGVGYRYAVD